MHRIRFLRASLFLSLGTLLLLSSPVSPQGKKKTQMTPQLLVFVAQELRRRFHAGCADVRLAEPIDLNPPHTEVVQSFRPGIVWSETWNVNVCGKQFVHHFDIEIVAAPQGQGGIAPGFTFSPPIDMPAGGLPPGDVRPISPSSASDKPPAGSLATPELAANVLARIRKFHPECNLVKAISLIQQEPKAGAGQQPGAYRNGQTWSETWAVDVCGKKQSHHTDFFFVQIRGQPAFILKTYPRYL